MFVVRLYHRELSRHSTRAQAEWALEAHREEIDGWEGISRPEAYTITEEE